MTWFKVDDKFHSHSKVRKVLADDPAALALWVVAGSWSADNTTDGVVPDHQLTWLFPAGADEQAQKLVNARLWRRVRGGYEFHEWSADGDGTRRNPTREELEETRRVKAEAGRKGGLASGKTRSIGEARASRNASASAEAGAQQTVEPPSRPDREVFQTSPGGRAPALSRRARSPSPSPRTARPAPPARCVEHEFDDDPPRCAACLRAERMSEQDTQERRIGARHAEMRAGREDQRREVEACSLCDERGYAGSVVCNHDATSPERAERGRALIDEAMGWSRNGRDPS